MQRLRARSQAKLYDKDLLPSLKLNSSSFVGRTIIPLSKLDLDSNFVLKQQRRFKLMSTIEPSRQKKPVPRSKRSLLQSALGLQHSSKLISSDSRRNVDYNHHNSNEQLMQRFSSKNMLTLQQSKTSSKSYNFIKAYAANSHSGTVATTNDDRICIVTNLNKTSVKSKQLSFFSIYDGSQNIHKTDYYRDNLHLVLSANEELVNNEPERAIREAIMTVEKCYAVNNNKMGLNNCGGFEGSNGRVSYSVVVAIGQFAYVVVSGTAHAIISRGHGEHIEFISPKLIQPIIPNKFSLKQHIKKTLNNKRNELSSNVNNIIIQKVPLNQQVDDIDFILLGSEGLCEKIKQDELARKLWKYIINSKQDNIHTLLGQATLNLLYHVFGMSNTKNTSLIMLGFKNIQLCLKKSQKLNLPYMDE